MDESWLIVKLSAEEAEEKHGVVHERLGPDPVPFGFMNSAWNALVEQMLPGDELWEFSSPPPSWERMAGRAGIVLIRDGKMVGSIVTVMN